MIAVTGLIALTLTLTLTPYIGEGMKKRGIVGRDIHKPDQPEVAEMGGLAILIGVAVAISLSGDSGAYLPLAVFLLFGIVGVLDDLTNLKQSHKVLLSLLVSLPVAFLDVSHTLDLFGLQVNLGVLYPIFAVLFVTGSANLVNLLAGFNGLEAGTSAIILLFLAIIAGGEARLLALAGMAGALGFLWWNRYPARVFPGDTGTLSLGALIGLVAIVGKVEAYAAILLLPHFIDFLLKASGVRFKVRARGRTEVMPDGTLKAPPYPSLLGSIMRRVRVTEPRLVAIVWMIQFLLGFLVLLISRL